MPRLVLLILCSAVALAGLGDAVATAKPKPPTLRLTAPAAGAADVAVASIKLRKGAKPPALKVVSAPAGVVVTGGASASGRIAIAVASAAAAKPSGAAKPIVIRLTGRAKPSGVRVARDVAIAGGASLVAACPDLATLLARGLKGISGADAAALGRALAARACGGAPADPSVLTKLGLKTPPVAPKLAGAGTSPAATLAAATRPAASRGADTDNKPGTGTGATPPKNDPPAGSADACRNGKDDDGDGQADSRGAGAGNPDPGCTSAADTTETGEIAVSAECAGTSGVFGGANGPTTASAAINDPCPQIEHVWMTIAPGVTSCVAMSAASNYDCAGENGLLHTKRTAGAPDNRIDFFTINLSGNLDCSKATTIAIQQPDGAMYELVEPLPANACSTAPPPPIQCANGIDDDNDGQIDAPSAPNATDPDPGCANATDDNTEGSELALPQGCDVDIGFLGVDARQTAFSASGCGELTGAWFSPSRTPAGCEYKLGQEDPVGCGVIGATASAGFPEPSTEDLLFYGPVSQAPACGAKLTAALRRSDGAWMESRVQWTGGC